MLPKFRVCLQTCQGTGRLSGVHKPSFSFRQPSGSNVPRKSPGGDCPYWRHSQVGRNEPKKSDFEHEIRDHFNAARRRPSVTQCMVCGPARQLALAPSSRGGPRRRRCTTMSTSVRPRAALAGDHCPREFRWPRRVFLRRHRSWSDDGRKQRKLVQRVFEVVTHVRSMRAWGSGTSAAILCPSRPMNTEHRHMFTGWACE